MPSRSLGTILVVDDDRDIREAIEDVLEREGYTVVLAKNGVEAQAALGAGAFDLLLLDLMMPTMNGWELLDRIGGARPPVIVLSAVPGEVDPAGLHAVLKKPIDRGALLVEVGRHVRRAGRSP